MSKVPRKGDGLEACTPPKEAVFGGFMARLRAGVRRQSAAAAEEPRTNAKTYAPGDFEFMRDRLNLTLADPLLWASGTVDSMTATSVCGWLE